MRKHYKKAQVVVQYKNRIRRFKESNTNENPFRQRNGTGRSEGTQISCSPEKISGCVHLQAGGNGIF